MSKNYQDNYYLTDYAVHVTPKINFCRVFNLDFSAFTTVSIKAQHQIVEQQLNYSTPDNQKNAIKAPVFQTFDSSEANYPWLDSSVSIYGCKDITESLPNNNTSKKKGNEVSSVASSVSNDDNKIGDNLYTTWLTNAMQNVPDDARHYFQDILKIKYNAEALTAMQPDINNNPQSKGSAGEIEFQAAITKALLPEADCEILINYPERNVPLANESSSNSQVSKETMHEWKCFAFHPSSVQSSSFFLTN